MNMTELIAFLVQHIKHLVTSKQIPVITTNGSVILHLADAINKGFNKILLCTVDTDVIVLSVAAVAKIVI